MINGILSILNSLLFQELLGNYLTNTYCGEHVPFQFVHLDRSVKFCSFALYVYIFNKTKFYINVYSAFMSILKEI